MYYNIHIGIKEWIKKNIRKALQLQLRTLLTHSIESVPRYLTTTKCLPFYRFLPVHCDDISLKFCHRVWYITSVAESYEINAGQLIILDSNVYVLVRNLRCVSKIRVLEYNTLACHISIRIESRMRRLESKIQQEEKVKMQNKKSSKMILYLIYNTPKKYNISV